MAHAALVRSTRGYLAARWFGAPILLLETAGRRTGRPHAAPLVYLPDGDDLVVVPANAGADRTPAWWLNLRAAGEGVAIVDGLRRPVSATVTEGARRDRLWRRFGAVSPVEHYQHQTPRRLPVVALTPLPAPASHRGPAPSAVGVRALSSRPAVGVERGEPAVRTESAERPAAET